MGWPEQEDYGPADASSGVGKGGTGGSGGTTGTEQKQYKKGYVQVLYNLYGRTTPTKWQSEAMGICAKRGWPPSMFLTMLRRHDPMYARSDDYKNRSADAFNTWRRYFPGPTPFGPIPKKMLERYARSGRSRMWLEQRIQQTEAFKKFYPYWRMAAGSGTQAGWNPITYREWAMSINRAMKSATGAAAPKDMHRMFFASGMTPEEFQQRFQDVMGGAKAHQWAFGGNPATTGYSGDFDRNLLNRAIFSRSGAGQTIAQLGRGVQAQQSFMKSKNQAFGLNVNEQTGDVVSARI